MKKAKNAKKELPKKKGKKSDSGELKKPSTLKPMKEKEKKNWKANLNEEDEDFDVPDDDLKLEDFSANSDDDEEDDGFYDDRF